MGWPRMTAWVVYLFQVVGNVCYVLAVIHFNSVFQRVSLSLSREGEVLDDCLSQIPFPADEALISLTSVSVIMNHEIYIL